MTKKNSSQTPSSSPSPSTSISTDDSSVQGEIKINHSVIASIVRLAATQVEGVHSVSGSLVEGIAEFFSRRETDRGVRISEDENGEYTIEVRVIVYFGFQLTQTALQIQNVVADHVSKMTLKKVKQVNVIVDGVKAPNPPSKISTHKEND